MHLHLHTPWAGAKKPKGLFVMWVIREDLNSLGERRNNIWYSYAIMQLFMKSRFRNINEQKVMAETILYDSITHQKCMSIWVCMQKYFKWKEMINIKSTLMSVL